MSFLATTYSSSNNGKMQPKGNTTAKSAKYKQGSNKKGFTLKRGSFRLNFSSKIFKNSRSVSRERTHNFSMGQITASNRRSASINAYGLNSSGKLINGHLGPKEFEDSNEFLIKKEFISNWLENAKNEFKAGNYDLALKDSNKVLKSDPNHPKALFIRASCYISTNKHKVAIPDLLSIIQENPTFDKNVYIALAICFVEVEDFTTAIRQLTKGISFFPNFAEGLINRGMMFNRQKRWDKAISDFHEAILMNPLKGSGYLGLADSLIGMKDSATALSMLEQALQDQKSVPLALLKRGKIYFEQQEFNKALKDLDKVLEIQPENVEALYYKAFVFLGLSNIIDAGLTLEQVIKYDYLKKYTGPAIYNLGAIKIKQKDYYGAMFTFQRAVDLGVEIEEQKVLKSYVESILFLIKRKFKEGVKILTKMIKSKNLLIQEYIGNCYSFRGYGYASLENHEKAVKDLNIASGLQALDKSSEYNLLVSKAILLSEKDPEPALLMFSKAGAEFPNNIEYMIYSAAINFRLAQERKRQDLADKSKEFLDVAIKIRETEADLFFFRGIVQYYLGNTIEAVHDIEQAIDKAEDNVVDHFVARGLCSARLKMHKEAIQDFCIAIQLNEKCSEAYYYRGRCAFIMDETSTAFEDFQKLINLNPENPEVHIKAGNLLMLNGSIEDALKAYNNANIKTVVPESNLQRAKCFLMTENLEEAIIELSTYKKFSTDPAVNYDLDLLEILNTAHNKESLRKNLAKTVFQLSNLLLSKTEGHICSGLQVHWYKGVFLFFLGEFSKAKIEFKQALTNKDDSEDESMERENIELLYNISIIYILGEYYEAALAHLNEIVYYLEGKDRGKVLLLMGVLNLGLEQEKEAKSLITEGFKFDPDTVQMYFDEKPEIKVLPLSSNSKYASVFPMAKVRIGKSHPFLVRPSFSLPKVELPRIEFEIEQNLLEKFQVKSVKCKPETPWLNRIKGSIQFTDEIQILETDSLNSLDEPAKVPESQSYSDATMRKYKSESLSRRDNKQESVFDNDYSESSLEGIVDDTPF